MTWVLRQKYQTFSLAKWVLILTLFGSQDASAQILPDSSLSNPSAINQNGELTRITGGTAAGNNLFHSFREFNVLTGETAYFDNALTIDNILTRVTGGQLSNIDGLIRTNGTANLFLLNPAGIVFGANARLDVGGSFVGSTAHRLLFEDGSFYSATEGAGTNGVGTEALPLLTLSVPMGLQYGANAGSVTNGGMLAVGRDLTLSGGTVTSTGPLIAPQGNLVVEGVMGEVRVREVQAQTATLAARGNLILEESQLQTAGNLTLQGGDTVQVRDSTLRPFVALAGEQLEVQGDRAIDLLALNHPDSGLFSGGDLLLRSGGTVNGDARYWSGGSLRIEQLDGSLGPLFASRDPVIRASGDISFDSYRGASLHLFAGGSVIVPGSIEITNPDANAIQDTVSLSNGTTVAIDGSTQPTLDIRAGSTDMGAMGMTPNSPDGFSPTPPDTGGMGTRADISIGSIQINQPNARVFLTNQYQPNPALTGGITVGKIDTTHSSGGGAVTIDSAGSITLNGGIDASGVPVSISASLLDLTFSGNGGEITLLAAGDITFVPGTSAVISLGEVGGPITLNSGGNIVIDDGIIANLTTGEGASGDIALTAQSIFLSNFARVVAVTFGSGQSGNIMVNAADTVEIIHQGEMSLTGTDNFFIALVNEFLDRSEFNGTGIGTTTGSAGDAGDVTIETDRLIIRNENDPTMETQRFLAGVVAGTLPFSSGNGGNLTVNATDLVELVGNDPERIPPIFRPDIARQFLAIATGLTTAINGSGSAGNLTIHTGRLTIRDSASVTTGNSRFSSGNSGSLTVNATQSLELQGFAALASGTVGSGDANDLVVNTPLVTLRDGAALIADTIGTGDAGNLTVNADRVRILSGSRIGAATIDPEIINNGVASVNTGTGGTVTVNASELVEVAGISPEGQIPSGLFTDSNSTGEAGDLNINTGRLRVQDGATIAVSAEGSGAAGILNVEANAIELEDRGSLSAETTAGFGSITLESEELILRRQSKITTNATGTATGGNITIDTDVLAALENSDISANAEAASGGRVAIETQGIFGTEFREELTLQSDITATSELGPAFSGIVEINTPEVDPASGLVNLPESPVDITGLIGRDPCLQNRQSEFTLTGRGGVPNSPYEPIGSSPILDDVQIPTQWSENSGSENSGSETPRSETPDRTGITPDRAVEATGWIVNEKGQVVLIHDTSDSCHF